MSVYIQDVFLGRQPILDRNQNIVAYELLFRSSALHHAEFGDDSTASAQVMLNVFSELPIDQVLGDKIGFINVNAEMLHSDMIELLPSDKVVLELLETIRPDAGLVKRCRELREKGFSLALDDYGGGSDFEDFYDIVDVVKVDLPQIPFAEMHTHVDQFKRFPIKLLAEKVETMEQAQRCRELGFDLFQGYYFAHPVVISGKRADTSRLALLKLVSLVQGDADSPEIERVFKADPSLSFNLLRMVNSVAMGMRCKIGSLRQAIVVIGYRQLQRWLQLLLFVNPGGNLQSPLLELAASRGRLMELLSAEFPSQEKDFGERAFMVGIMSLLDAMFGTPMQEIVRQVNLADEVVDALVEQKGTLGSLLSLVRALEERNFEAATQLLSGLHVSQAALNQAQLDTLRWVNDIRRSAED